VTPEMAAGYLQSLDLISNNIKDMFEKQAAESQVRFIFFHINFVGDGGEAARVV
jgi:hypothetical protein